MMRNGMPTDPETNKALRKERVAEVIKQGEKFHPPSADVEVIRALYLEHPDALVRLLANHIISLRQAVQTERETNEELIARLEAAAGL